MKKVIIAAMIILSSCTQTKPTLLSVKGFQHVLTDLDKSNIDEYLLHEGYVFKQQIDEPEDQSYFPKPLRHIYENTTTKVFIEVAYFGFRAFEIRAITNDANVYLTLKTDAKDNQFTVKNISDNAGTTTVSYVLPDKKQFVIFTQRNESFTNKYVVVFRDNKIADEAGDAITHRSSGVNDRIGVDTVKTDSVMTEPMPVDTVTHRRATTNSSGVKVYNFPTSVLYPGDNGADLDSTHFVVNGVITDANFDNGAFRVKATDGEPVDIQIYPRDASSETANNLRLALKPGNRIKSICARAGAATVDLYSAKIYVSPNH